MYIKLAIIVLLPSMLTLNPAMTKWKSHDKVRTKVPKSPPKKRHSVFVIQNIWCNFIISACILVVKCFFL